jgi:thiamine-monophosphate kinase
MSGLERLGEFGLVDLFRSASTAQGARAWVERGIGDDCAVLKLAGGQRLLVTCDMLVEGVHFSLPALSARQLGHKALAVNLSDVAAMGGEATAALLGLGLPADCEARFAREFRDGLLACAGEFGVDLIGGDTVASPEGIVLSLTVLGQARADEVVLRGGAREGDRILVADHLGDSAAGLHLLRTGAFDEQDENASALLAAHRVPRPQLDLGRLLSSRKLVSAMIDVSDGLVQDLGHLAAASGLSAELLADCLPVSSAARWLGERDGVDPLDWALTGGEDYTLLFCAEAKAAAEAERVALGELGIRLTDLGRMVAGEGVRVKRAGVWNEMERGGHDHFSGRDLDESDEGSHGQ